MQSFVFWSLGIRSNFGLSVHSILAYIYHRPVVMSAQADADYTDFADVVFGEFVGESGSVNVGSNVEPNWVTSSVIQSQGFLANTRRSAEPPQLAKEAGGSCQGDAQRGRHLPGLFLFRRQQGRHLRCARIQELRARAGSPGQHRKRERGVRTLGFKRRCAKRRIGH